MQLVHPFIVAGVCLSIFPWCVNLFVAERMAYADGIVKSFVTLVVNPILVADPTVAICLLYAVPIAMIAITLAEQMPLRQYIAEVVGH